MFNKLVKDELTIGSIKSIVDNMRNRLTMDTPIYIPINDTNLTKLRDNNDNTPIVSINGNSYLELKAKCRHVVLINNIEVSTIVNGRCASCGDVEDDIKMKKSKTKAELYNGITRNLTKLQLLQKLKYNEPWLMGIINSINKSVEIQLSNGVPPNLLRIEKCVDKYKNKTFNRNSIIALFGRQIVGTRTILLDTPNFINICTEYGITVELPMFTKLHPSYSIKLKNKYKMIAEFKNCTKSINSLNISVINGNIEIIVYKKSSMKYGDVSRFIQYMVEECKVPTVYEDVHFILFSIPLSSLV